MKATRLIIKKHLENALPLVKRYVENSKQESDFENYNDDLDDYDIDDEDFISSASAIQDLITQDEFYHMARRIFQVVILGNGAENMTVDKVEDLKLIEIVTDLYVSLRQELKSSHIDTELLESYLVQLEHYQKKL
jgi:hypothetical protein